MKGKLFNVRGEPISRIGENKEIIEIELELQKALIPKDPDDNKSIFLILRWPLKPLIPTVRLQAMQQLLV